MEKTIFSNLKLYCYAYKQLHNGSIVDGCIWLSPYHTTECEPETNGHISILCYMTGISMIYRLSFRCWSALCGTLANYPS